MISDRRKARNTALRACAVCTNLNIANQHRAGDVVDARNTCLSEILPFHTLDEISIKTEFQTDIKQIQKFLLNKPLYFSQNVEWHSQ